MSERKVISVHTEDVVNLDSSEESGFIRLSNGSEVSIDFRTVTRLFNLLEAKKKAGDWRPSSLEKKKQLGNTVRYGTTVRPIHDALVKGLSISITGERATRGSVADITMQLIEKHFSEKYEMPFYLLEEVLEESGVLEKIEREEEDKAKPVYYPLSEEVVEAVVRDYKARLVGFNYGGGDENKPSTL